MNRIEVVIACAEEGYDAAKAKLTSRDAAHAVASAVIEAMEMSGLSIPPERQMYYDITLGYLLGRMKGENKMESYYDAHPNN